MHSPTPPKCSTRAIMALINNLGIVYHQYCSSSDALAFIAPTAGRVDIAIALAPFLVVHRSQVTIASFLVVELQSRRPSP
jgi:hypothetical protein